MTRPQHRIASLSFLGLRALRKVLKEWECLSISQPGREPEGIPRGGLPSLEWQLSGGEEKMPAATLVGQISEEMLNRAVAE